MFPSTFLSMYVLNKPRPCVTPTPCRFQVYQHQQPAVSSSVRHGRLRCRALGCHRDQRLSSPQNQMPKGIFMSTTDSFCADTAQVSLLPLLPSHFCHSVVCGTTDMKSVNNYNEWTVDGSMILKEMCTALIYISIMLALFFV